MMGIFGRFRLAGASLLWAGFAVAAQGADYTYRPVPAPVEVAGYPCDLGWNGEAYQLMPAYWSSLWIGHFSGGVSQYDRGFGTVMLIWGDEKRCFPSRQACTAWVASLRRNFHHPEGEWTCLPLR